MIITISTMKMRFLLIVLAGALLSKVASTKLTTKSKTYDSLVDHTFTGVTLFQSPARSDLHCGMLCSRLVCCATFTFAHEVCTGHAVSKTSETPSMAEQGARVYSRKTAATKPKSCMEAQRHNNGSGLVILFNSESDDSPLRVYCDQDTNGGGWLVFQRRQDGSVDFYRNLTEYQNGFGDVLGEHWLGLDALHMLTSCQKYELGVDLMKFGGTKGYITYSNFSISDSSDNYRLHLGAKTGGPIDDSLKANRGLPFSTWDSDHDAWTTGNCAQSRTGGWWYGNCGYSNLNGPYVHSRQSDYNNIIWYGFDSTYSLKFTEMKIRIV